MSDHYPFMSRALELADKAALLGEVPVGAVVVRDGQIIAEGHNLRESLQDPTAHAELLALREASRALQSWRLSDSTVYVTLEPCAMCAGAMVLARVRRCVFGCPDPKGGFMGSLGDLSSEPRLNHSFEVVSGVLTAECSDRLSTFFKALRERRSGPRVL